MRLLIQRVSQAYVEVNSRVIGAIGPGLVVLVGIATGDSEVEADWLAQKVADLRVFNDDEGKMNLSLLHVGGSALVVSQFTLYADSRKGNRPNFMRAAKSEHARELYEYFLGALGRVVGAGKVQSGEFQTDMKISLVNEGPVTIMLEREPNGAGDGTV